MITGRQRGVDKLNVKFRWPNIRTAIASPRLKMM